MYAKPCEQHGHRYFVADVAVVEAEGKVIVMALCTSCGDFITHEVIVSMTGAKLKLIKPENKKAEV